LKNFIFDPGIDRLLGAEAKLGLKFGDNRGNGLGVIEFLVFSQMAAGGHLGFQKFKILMSFSYCGFGVDDSCQIWFVSD
jgi:hypothetical protein